MDSLPKKRKRKSYSHITMEKQRLLPQNVNPLDILSLSRFVFCFITTFWPYNNRHHHHHQNKHGNLTFGLHHYQPTTPPTLKESMKISRHHHQSKNGNVLIERWMGEK